ncbi:hypothetical protein DPMN_022886 [Dreissena polymorpha]|uniref:F-box domain-containing protein n=2 Tax=Dreissena polymorpha TaxID=45954 RepID=A0A9D4R9F5_DREPO|nr:hypothetical protein DPMN_022886 [Dreissena polymorpha]
MEEYNLNFPQKDLVINDVDIEERTDTHFILNGPMFDDAANNITVTLDEDIASFACTAFSDNNILWKEDASYVNEGITAGNSDAGVSEEFPSKFEKADESPFNNLPDEIIVNIFSYLKVQDLCKYASPVCHKWRALVKDHSLWHVLDFSNFHNLSSFNLLQVIRRAPLLRKLSLRGRVNLSPVEIAIICESCPRIQELDLGFCSDVTETVLQIIIENCSVLQKINVEGGNYIGKRCLQVMSQSLSLTALNFSHCMTIQNDDVRQLAEHLKIIAINLDGNNFITDSGVFSLVKLQSAHLQELELDGAEITDASLYSISQCMDLQRLGISFCECLTDQSLQYLKNCHNLEHLRLRKGSDFTQAGLSAFFKSGTLAHLRTLNLSECTAINDNVMLDIVQCCGSCLYELVLSWCWNISDMGLVSIMDHCCKLMTLDLLGIDSVLGECLERIPEDLPKLTYLDLRQCNKIVDSIIMDVVRRKPDLKVINPSQKSV